MEIAHVTPREMKTVDPMPGCALSPMSPPAGFISNLEQALGQFSQGIKEKVGRLQERALTGHAFSPRELLLMQVQMGRFNMQVELVSRVAESATSTIKRLQNG